MIDPEALKTASRSAVREAGAEVLFHAWASRALVENGRVLGAAFEGKGGRFAVTARVVVDTTGDGDLFTSAGEASAGDVESSSIQQCINTAWLCAGVDCEAWLRFRRSPDYEAFSARAREALGLFEWPIAGWRNDVAVFMGPRWAGYDGLDVRDLTEVELRFRDKMAKLLAYYRTHAWPAWLGMEAPVQVTMRFRDIGGALQAAMDGNGVTLARSLLVADALCQARLVRLVGLEAVRGCSHIRCRSPAGATPMIMQPSRWRTGL